MDDDKFYVPNRLEIKPGAFYFVAKCPNTKKILAIERDPDRGSHPYWRKDHVGSQRLGSSGIARISVASRLGQFRVALAPSFLRS